MLHQGLWLCFTLPWVSMYRLNEIKDVSAFRKYALEQQCTSDGSFAEFKPCGILNCFSKCLQFASCTHVKYHPKEMKCRICKAVPSGKPKNSKSRQGWICWKKRRLVPCPECLQETRCIRTRSGQTTCVPYGLQDKLQKEDRMLTQVDKVTELLNTTPQALNDKWISSRVTEVIKSMTWSPLCLDDFYCLGHEWLGYSIKRYRLKGNTLVLQSGQMRISHSSCVPHSIDTGPCLADDSMNCIYIFGQTVIHVESVLYVRPFRVISPRKLVAERHEHITQRVIPVPSFKKCLFANNWKSGMAIYLPQGERSAMKKYSIQADEGALSLKEAGHVEGLKDIQHFKWNNDGTFAFAISATTLYLISDMEQVLIGVQHKWDGRFTPVCTNTSIVVFMRCNNVGCANILKF